MFLRADGPVVEAALTSLSLLEFLDSQEKGLVSLLPIGAGGAAGAAAGAAAGGVAAAGVLASVVATGELLAGDEGTAAAALLIKEVVLLSWSFSEGLVGSAGTISDMQSNISCEDGVREVYPGVVGQHHRPS